MKAKFLALMALVLGMVSCQNDFEGTKIGGDEVAVTLNVAVPDDATRAAGNDSGIGAIGNIDLVNKYDIRYVLNVYDKDGELAKGPITKYQDEALSEKFTISLVPGRYYKFVVWADFVLEGTENPLHYDVTDFAEIKTLTEQLPMDESRDAYTGFIEVAEFNGSNAIDKLVLTRPFAKLRVVTTDMNELYTNLETATVVYTSRLYTTFNAIEAEATGLEGMAGITKYVDFTTDNDDYVYNETAYEAEGKKTLFADYFFGAEDNKVTFTFDVTDNTDNAIPQVVFNTNIPVQRNYLTTVQGPILTDSNNITVIINDAFNKPDNVVDIWDGESATEPEVSVNSETGEAEAIIDSASDLAWLADYFNGLTTSTFATRASEPVNFVLQADIDLNNMPWTPIGFNPNEEAGNENPFTGTFDGNGHTIYNVNVDVEDKGGVGFFGAVNNATIKNVTFHNVFVKAVESEENPANISGAQQNPNYIAGGHIGAVAGYDAAPWGTGNITFENVHVTGLVQIEGETRAAQGQRVGGIIGGRGYSNMSFKNVSVIGTEGSYIKGYCSTAAVAGQPQGVCTYENVATDIDVYAVTFGAGGIVGIATKGSSFNNCSSKGNVTLDASKTQLSSYSANYPFRVGGIAGCWSESKSGVLTLTNCSYYGTLTSIDKDGNSPEAFDYAGYVGRGYTLKNCAGSKVIINGTEYVQAYDTVYGVYYVNGDYEVNTVADFKALANDVNNNDNTFKGITVKLGADIDLKNEEWTPIGSAYADHGFMGNFDGNGYTVKNLKITNITPDADGYVYAGLFGVTEGTDANKQNYIKNLIIENVTIETTGHIAAAAIAYPYYTEIENITVKGNISIKGGDYTSGVLAYTRRCVDANNIAIEATNGLIEGNITVGGVISDIQMNGGLTANYSNFAASGLTIKAAQNVGGISGIICNQTLDGATVKNVTIDCKDERRGIVAGAEGGKSTLNNVSYENVTGATRVIGATYDGGLIVVSTADELVEALENGKGVYLFNDIKIDPASMSNAYGKTGINVKNGQTIDGGGHTLNIKGAGGTWDSGIATTGGLIKNLTVTGSFRGIFIKGGDYTEKVVLDNVTITGTTYTISCDQGKYQGIEATNCTFNGWTSFAKTAGEAKFTNCYFGEGNGYKYCRPYSNTEFVECTFCPGFTVDTTRATVTFTDCTWEE